jgi:hypothetical protein
MLTKTLIAAALVGTATATGPTTVGFTHTVNWDTHTTGTLNVAIGDKVKFGPWTGAYSLWKMPNEARFNACTSFSSAQQVAGAKDPAAITISATSYYASKEGCQNKKIMIAAAARTFKHTVDLTTCGTNCNKAVVIGESVKFTAGGTTVAAVGANVFNGACTVSSGKNVVNGEVTFSTAGTYYYTTKNKAKCEAGEKAMITVTAQPATTTTTVVAVASGPDCAAKDGVCKDVYTCTSNIDALKTCVTTNCPSSYNDAKVAELSTATACVAGAKALECADADIKTYCKLDDEAFDGALDVLNNSGSSLSIGFAALAWLLA